MFNAWVSVQSSGSHAKHGGDMQGEQHQLLRLDGRCTCLDQRHVCR